MKDYWKWLRTSNGGLNLRLIPAIIIGIMFAPFVLIGWIFATGIKNK